MAQPDPWLLAAAPLLLLVLGAMWATWRRRSRERREAMRRAAGRKGMIQ